MGYLDNSSITVDAILTKRGRELLSRNDGSFKITQFTIKILSYLNRETGL